MSRIAKNPVTIPSGVEVVLKDQLVSVKGPKGQLDWQVPKSVKVAEVAHDVTNDKLLTFMVTDDSLKAKAMSGTARALVNNMVIGVSKGFERALELNGVGYRAQAQGQKINLTLGFSHPVEYNLPADVTVETPSNTVILLKSIDKQKLGQVASEIRAFRPPEPYKGKGIRYAGERIVRKETKKK